MIRTHIDDVVVPFFGLLTLFKSLARDDKKELKSLARGSEVFGVE